MITDGLDLTSSSARFVGVGPDFNTNHELNSLSKASLNLQKEKFDMFKILAIHQNFFSTTIG